MYLTTFITTFISNILQVTMMYYPGRTPLTQG